MIATKFNKSNQIFHVTTRMYIKHYIKLMIFLITAITMLWIFIEIVRRYIIIRAANGEPLITIGMSSFAILFILAGNIIMVAKCKKNIVYDTFYKIEYLFARDKKEFKIFFDNSEFMCKKEDNFSWQDLLNSLDMISNGDKIKMRYAVIPKNKKDEEEDDNIEKIMILSIDKCVESDIKE